MYQSSLSGETDGSNRRAKGNYYHVSVYAATFAPGDNSPPDRAAVDLTRMSPMLGESVSTPRCGQDDPLR